MQLGGRADYFVPLFGVVYLALCDFAIEPTKEQQVCKSLQECDWDSGND
jgi:hypothetical protein